MPRPSKPVSPDTLGGRIRAARKNLHLSLAEVTQGHYSTSLLSQIERNRIDPSQESLRFLAHRLEIPFEDLEILAQQRHNTFRSTRISPSYDELWIEAQHFFQKKETCRALELLHDLHLSHISPDYRWRIAALRGQCYFAHRKFLKAEHDFIYAVHEHPHPDDLPGDQLHELMLLHLHLAGTYRELQQIDDALEQYHITLKMMNSHTPFGYVAEAHWGIALIAFAQANKMNSTINGIGTHEQRLHTALEHAENARFLYRSIGEQLQGAAVSCQIARIEQALGNKAKARSYLQEVLATWTNVFKQPVATSGPEKRIQQQEANVVSAAACTLAGIELESGNYDLALISVERALEAGRRSYKLRRANAYLMLGRILEHINPRDPAIERTLYNATEELCDTDRIAVRISAHAHLGRHLLKIGKIIEGERELEQARLLSDMVSTSDTSTAEDAALS